LSKIIEREDAREASLERIERENRLPDDFKVVPVYRCECDHSTRASGFCKHGNNI
jgi:hypothetical protein